jgi:2-polyprenyl-6-methoxyphenol hydroxylase-like FAD-dependent oxidoreductase
MRVLIIGAGIAGTTLALFLMRAGFAVALFEGAPAAGGGAALAIAANGLAVLDAAGVLDDLEPASTRTRDWAFEGQGGAMLACIEDARRKSRLQTRMISRPMLQATMEEHLRAEGIAIRYGKRLMSVEDEPGGPVGACFEDGSFAEGDCLIGADGIGSRVRRSILPEAPLPAYTGFMAAVGFSPCPAGEVVTAGSQQRVHLIFGRECFFEYVNIVTPDGPRVVWWSTAETDLVSRQETASLTTEDLRARLLMLHRDWAEPVPELIRSAESILPLAIHDFPALPRWSVGRSLLIGDAAHAVGPHSGQASSMALEDAMMLGERMRGATPETLRQVFAGFERERQARLERVFALGARAAERKEVMSPLKFWMLQQTMRVRVPLGSLKSKRWLLDYRVPPAYAIPRPDGVTAQV